VFEAGTARINVRYVPHGAFTVTGDKTLKLLTVHIVDKGKPLYIPAKPWRPENRRDNRPQQGRSPGPVEPRLPKRSSVDNDSASKTPSNAGLAQR
jgi:hypothetical protein